MIKKELKTLTQVQNPKEEFWRVYHPRISGSFYDVESTYQRDRILYDIFADYQTSGQYPVHVEYINGINTISVPITVSVTTSHTLNEVEEEDNTFFGLLKEDIGGWDWKLFFLKSGFGIIVGLLFTTLHYLMFGPIMKTKTDSIPFHYTLFTLIGLAQVGMAIGWTLYKTGKILPYITCFLKIPILLFLHSMIHISVGIFSQSKSTEIRESLPKYIYTKKELRIINSTTK